MRAFIFVGTLGKSGRLTHPMVFNSQTDKYEKISWNDAFLLIAKELKSLKTPNEAIFYTSGRTSNEAAFLYQLMVRRFGTNNLPDCSNMCHESSGTALSETLGIGKGSVTLDDFNHAELVMVIGQNPGTNHPRMLSALESNNSVMKGPSPTRVVYALVMPKMESICRGPTPNPDDKPPTVVLEEVTYG